MDFGRAHELGPHRKQEWRPGETHGVGDPQRTRGDKPMSVRLPHLLPLLPTNVKKQMLGHAPANYVPHQSTPFRHGVNAYPTCGV